MNRTLRAVMLFSAIFVGRAWAVPVDCQLVYTNSSFELNIHPNTQGKEVIFTKEPDYGGHAVIKSVMPFGPDAKKGIGFAWDREGARLYLDRNRNFDLTDDGLAFEADEREDWQQIFRNITLTNDTPVGLEYRVSFTFYSYPSMSRNRALNYRLGVNSGWRQTVKLGDQSFDLALVDDLDGKLDAGDLLLVAPAGVLKGNNGEEDSSYRVQGGQALFVGGKEIHVAMVPDTGNAWKATVTEETPKLGVLKVEGERIRRLVMDTGGRKVLLDRPSGAIAVPVGTYGQQQVHLDVGTNSPLEARRYEQLVVKEGQETVLKLGAPLVNSVKISRRGSSLNMNYSLKGQGGETYSPPSYDRKTRPEFAVYQGDRKIGAGQFQFG